MKYKMIVADYDDTIINDDLQYSDRFADAVYEYVKRGGVFTIASGRVTKPIQEVCKDLGLSGEAISYQGAVIFDIASGKPIESTTIDCNTALEVCKVLDGFNTYYHLYEDERLITKVKTNYSEMYAKLCGYPLVEFGDKLTDYIRESNLNTLKILAMDSAVNIPRYIEELTSQFGDKLLINSSKKWMLEIVNKQISKATAVARLCEMHGISREEVVCVGDSMNDLQMIEYAGLGICMANGNEYVKSKADFVCPSSNDDGIDYVVRKFGLEEDI